METDEYEDEASICIGCGGERDQPDSDYCEWCDRAQAEYEEECNQRYYAEMETKQGRGPR